MRSEILMTISMQLIVVAVAACLCLAQASPDLRLPRKQQRPTRGFKNVEMMTARGFGKRDHPAQRTELYDLDNFWETLEATAEKENLDFLDEKESIPLDWFVNEMMNNPDFARSVVRKFIDLNQDGLLSSNELLRNSA